MKASDLAQAAAAAFTSLSGAIADVDNTLTTDPGYSTLESTAATKLGDAMTAASQFKTAAEVLAAVNVTFNGVAQTAVEMANKLYSKGVSATIGLSATEASDAATVFSSVVDNYVGMGE